MEWWQILLISVTTIVAGFMFGLLLILVTYLRKRYINNLGIGLASVKYRETILEEKERVQGLEFLAEEQADIAAKEEEKKAIQAAKEEEKKAKQAAKEEEKKAIQLAKEEEKKAIQAAKEEEKRAKHVEEASEQQAAKEEAKRIRQAAKEEAKKAKQMAEEEAKRERQLAEEEAKKARAADKVEVTEIFPEKEEVEKTYTGFATLLVALPVDPDQIVVLEECLHEVQDLRVVLVGGSSDVGARIVVFAEKPLQLLSILNEMPPVKEVISEDNEILLVLKNKAE